MTTASFTHLAFSLENLMSNIETGLIGLPDIQRPFVWQNTKVRDLFDSMYRGYPVGYLLFWANPQIASFKTIGTDTKQLPPAQVIVDGQQRLTSLYAVVKGVPVVRSNYNTERIRIAFNPVEERFEVTSAAIERDRSFIPDISKLWSSDTSIIRFVSDFLEELSTLRDVSAEEAKKIEDAIVRLQGLLAFQFSALQLSADTDEEAVAEVFVRINSQGKTLNQADFILTLMSVYWDEGRKELEEFCRNARQPSSGQATPFNYFIEPSPDQLLRVAVGLAFKRARLEHVYSILRGKDLETKEFSDERREAQFERLRDAQSKVLNLQHWHDFMQCLRAAGYRRGRMVISQTALVYTYTLYLIGRTELGVNEYYLRQAIAQWFFMSALTARYTGSPESRMESDLAMLRDVTTPQQFTTRLRQTCNVTLTNDYWEQTLPTELATSAARSPSLFAYEAALVLLQAPVLLSKTTVEQMMDPVVSGGVKSIERHHLFPRGYLERIGIKGRRDINQIANYAYVEWSDNVRISDQAPEEYMPPLKERHTAAELAQMYNYHALPNGWESMDYSDFLARRRELIAGKIRDGYMRLTGQSEADDEAPPINVESLIASGEGDLVELKSTLRVNLHTGKPDKRMELAVLRTLAGFLNKDGGTLIVGVADDGSPVGLDADGFENEDKMGLHLVNIVNHSMGANVWAYMHTNFDDLDDGRVMVVRCGEAPAPVYVNHGGEVRFYVRTGPSTTQLSVDEATEFISGRFK